MSLGINVLEYDEWFRSRVQEAFQDEAEGRSNWKDHDDTWAELEADARKA
ncbi:hypothetical protein KPL74_04145 [Bacillus sp. NP157]|nr:hypothetical protein KPL74_04145 [Bacillus sp. NP157]